MPNSIVRHIKALIFNKRLRAAFALLLICLKAFPQQEGFFHLYDNMGGNYCASSVIETDDGNFLLAAFDQYAGSSCILIKLSSNGELLQKVPIHGGNIGAFINGIYCNPDDSTRFCAIGSLHFREEQVCKPFVLHFDESLNLIEEHEVDLPDDYKVFQMERSVQTRDGDFLFATSLDEQNGYHRLYMKIATDGTLMSFHEATNDCSSSIMINAIFEFPEGGYYGDYRRSHKNNLDHVERLFSFNDDFTFDTINEYPGIQQQNGNSTYEIKPFTIGNGTALPFGDSSLLFSDRAYEASYYGNQIDSDLSTLFSLADMNGNIIKYLVISSMNDTADYPVAFNAIDYVKSNNGEIKDRIYHGCFGTCNGWFPCDGPNHITLTQTDDGLNIRWQKTFSHPTKYLLAAHLLATHDGGCLVTGAAYQEDHYDLFALKTNTNGTLSTNEILAEDVRPYAYYPNPTQNGLHLQYSPDVTPTNIELYDLQGRFLRSQSTSLENLNMEGLTTGQYVMKVTMEDGKTFTDKVVKE